MKKTKKPYYQVKGWIIKVNALFSPFGPRYSYDMQTDDGQIIYGIPSAFEKTIGERVVASCLYRKLTNRDISPRLSARFEFAAAPYQPAAHPDSRIHDRSADHSDAVH